MPQGQSLDSSAFPSALNSQNNLAQNKSSTTHFAVAQHSIGGRKCSVIIQKAPIDTSSSFSTANIPSKNSDKLRIGVELAHKNTILLQSLKKMSNTFLQLPFTECSEFRSFHPSLQPADRLSARRIMSFGLHRYMFLLKRNGANPMVRPVLAC